VPIADPQPAWRCTHRLGSWLFGQDSPARSCGPPSHRSVTRIADRSRPPPLLSQPTPARNLADVPTSQGARAEAVRYLLRDGRAERSCPAPTASGRGVPRCRTYRDRPRLTLHSGRSRPTSWEAGCVRPREPWRHATSHGRGPHSPRWVHSKSPRTSPSNASQGGIPELTEDPAPRIKHTGGPAFSRHKFGRNRVDLFRTCCRQRTKLLLRRVSCAGNGLMGGVNE
jgi:hypothetical protein